VPLNLPPGYSRFKRYEGDPLTPEVVWRFREMINQIAAQAAPGRIYEHFKRHFGGVAGIAYFPSSDDGWASTDLSNDMDAAAASPPLFLCALWEGVEALQETNKYDLPDVSDINGVCKALGVPFRIQPPSIIAIDSRQAFDPAPTADLTRSVTTRRASAAAPLPAAPLPKHFDIAITYAGADRPIASHLAELLKREGLTVFYDRFYPEHLLGADLSETFDDVFRNRSRFCLMVISRAYAEREWTIHERRSAVARAVREKGKAYILPIRIDDTDLPGLPTTLGYLSLADHDIDAIGDIVVRKIRSEK